MDWNVLSAVGILIGIVVFVRFIMPYLRKNNIKLYEEVKLGLLIFGVSFRDDKIKKIANTILTIVTEMEKLDLSPEEKLYLAMDEAFVKILDEVNVELDDEIIQMLIQVAVAFLPPTNKPV